MRRKEGRLTRWREREGQARGGQKPLVSSLALPRPSPRYSVEGFIDKNRDFLFQDFKRLLYNR